MQNAPCSCQDHGDQGEKLISRIGLYYTLGALLFLVLFFIAVRNLIRG